jgi:hypothetical protein
LLRNVYNKNAYLSGNGVHISSASAVTNTLGAVASETVKLKNSTRYLLDRPADGYNIEIQTEADQRELRGEQIRASRAKKTPDRRGPKQTEELAESRVDRQTVKRRYTPRLRTIK